MNFLKIMLKKVYIVIEALYYRNQTKGLALHVIAMY